jgi:hypothetical protein
VTSFGETSAPRRRRRDRSFGRFRRRWRLGRFGHVWQADAAIAVSIGGVEEAKVLSAEFFAGDSAITVAVGLLRRVDHHGEHRHVRRSLHADAWTGIRRRHVAALDNDDAAAVSPALLDAAMDHMTVAARVILSVQLAVVIGVKFAEDAVGRI